MLPDATRTSIPVEVDPPQEPAIAWVEIHGAVLHCTCGAKTDFTDHVRQEFLSAPEHACSGCGTVWGTPAAADCERVTAELRR